MLIRVYLIFLISLPFFTYGKGVCVVVRKSGPATHAKTKNKQHIYRGEKFPFVRRNRKKTGIQFLIGDQKHWVSKKMVKGKKGSSCKPNLCVLLPDSAQSFEEPDGFPRTIPQGFHNILSQIEHQGANWYRLQKDDGFFWLDQTLLNKYQISCSHEYKDGTSEETVEASSSESSWNYGFEGGYIMNSSAGSLENILTPIPPSTVDVNDDAYDSPFIEEISEGSGFQLSVFVETPLFWGLRNKIMVGYTQRDLSYLSRPNPDLTTPPTVTYDQLGREEVTLSFRSAHLSWIPKYPINLWGLHLDLGVNFGFHYFLDETAVKFFTAPLKQNSYFKDTGHNGFEVFISPRFELHWRLFYLYGEMINRVSPETDFSLDPSLGLGTQF